MTLKIGDTLGRYELVRELGQGGMGIVYEGRHKSLGTRVAIKVLLAVHAKASSAAQRFAREGKIVAKLASPHIVRTLDADTTDEGYPYIVMEFCQGCDVAQLLEARGPLSVGEVAGIARQLCVGLAHAHAEGVVHRDLKPANLFIAIENSATVVKVMDFGIAKDLSAEEELTATSVMIGTAHYMAPEQIRSSRHATPASDLWSLGVIMFRLLTGRHPFAGATHTDIAMAVLLDPVPSLLGELPDVPPGFAAIVARLLTKDPASRLSSARELGEALAPYATEEISLEALSGPVTKVAPTSSATTQTPASKTPRMPQAAQPPNSLPLAPTVPATPSPEPSLSPVRYASRNTPPTIVSASAPAHAVVAESTTISGSPASSDREVPVPRAGRSRILAAATVGIAVLGGMAFVGGRSFLATRQTAQEDGLVDAGVAYTVDAAPPLDATADPLSIPPLPSAASATPSMRPSSTAAVSSNGGAPPNTLGKGKLPPGGTQGTSSGVHVVPSARLSVPNHID